MNNNPEKDNYHTENSGTEEVRSHANNLLLLESFQRDSRNRTLIVIFHTIVLVIFAAIFKNVWLILIGEAALWVIVSVWLIWKNKTGSIDDKKGFTPNQLILTSFIILALLALIEISLILPSRQNTQQVKDAATQNLKVFSTKARLKPVECTNQDSDNNGYVDCTAKNKDTKLLDLECAYDKRGKSCKIKLSSRQITQQVKDAATQNLKVFSTKAGLKPVECANQDSDNNGYVNCTAKNKDTKLLDLECAYDKRGKNCKIK